jgi:hypothetical protein
MSAAGESGLRIVYMSGEGQRMAELEAGIAMCCCGPAVGAEPTADFPPWVLLRVKIAACRERDAEDEHGKCGRVGTGFEVADVRLGQ